MKIRSMEAELFRADGQTDMTMLMFLFEISLRTRVKGSQGRKLRIFGTQPLKISGIRLL